MGRFEVVIKSPTLGLMTRIPGDQPDPRYATAASNVRFDDGVVRSAPGIEPILGSVLDSPVCLIFQCNVMPSTGMNRQVAVLIASEQKLYSLTKASETVFAFPEQSVVEFRGDLTTHDAIRQLPTTQTVIPQTIAVSISDDMEIWKLRQRAVGEDDNDNGFILPFDYGLVSNNKIWVRIR